MEELSGKINRLADYLTLTWLIRHRFKEVVGITIFMVSLTVLSGGPTLNGTVSAQLTSIVLQVVGALFGL